ncbi:Xylose isomerase domain protein TIM barrel [Solidesulfovibrio fructosivorans JJ]]|uniref:Xylose isomerase domain protein TIM barrel n=2 Tax=Solidesulfovibrio fructosivorans TaxID=878 RepID=E1JU03_SOLFR|nr:Xylose isomerase domain protein TIM barrel [Solidesulfovibrio fructosivorans JJ]]
MPPVTYCTNIHPGETLEEVRRGLMRHAVRVKARLSPDAPFPVGLRLSGPASRELEAADAARRFGDFLAEAGLCVTTVNGFPYGRFHHTPVKEAVYLPDWRDPERAAYTLRLARALAGWLPEGGRGSISTVPVGFRRGFPESDMPTALAVLRRALEALAALRSETGKTIRLAVEAEPGCLVETTPEMVALFERLDPDGAFRDFLTVCYDCCHQALQYEDPAASLAAYEAAGIAVGHVQVSSALHLEGGALSSLSRFVEPVYLHQAVARLGDGSLRRFDDLPEALAARPDDVDSWRVHFHVPVFVAELPECVTTRDFLSGILPRFAPDAPMEVETYTWSVLPEELRMPDVVDSICREIGWVEAARSGAAEG